MFAGIQTISTDLIRGVNIGGLSGIATTSLEKNYGFWTAFLLPLCSLFFSVDILHCWSTELQ
jgi:POT family proton-dependent oligopeptide transporter